MATQCEVLSEIEVLQSIYLDELQVTRREDGGWEVSLVLYPSTAEDCVSQFVRLALTLTLDQQYPWTSPAISIHNPRGLSDDKLLSIQKSLQMEAEAWLGSPVLYQLIEKAKEILTESNIPHGNCVICLYAFKEDESFTKTSCYHYFHSHCLGRYVTHTEQELRLQEKELEEDKTREGRNSQELLVVCPVCREPLKYDVDQLLSSPAPCLPKLEVAEVGADFKQKWHELQKLLEQQRAKGGIIDPEVESARFLIHINEAAADSEDGNPDGDGRMGISELPALTTPPVELCIQGEQLHASQSYCRGSLGQRRTAQPKGPRRGGGRGKGRQPNGRPAPPTECLDQLSLSSDSQGPSPEQSVKTRLQDNHRQHKLQNAVLIRSNTDCEGSTWINLEEQHCSVKQLVLQPGLVSNSACPRDTREPRGNRGRKRDPHGPTIHPGQWQERHLRGTDQGDPLGAMHCHWDGQGLRSRGGAYHPSSRRGGLHRGRGRGFNQSAVEREAGREKVL